MSPAILLILLVLGTLAVRRRWLDWQLSAHAQRAAWYGFICKLDQQELHELLVTTHSGRAMLLDLPHWNVRHYLADQGGYDEVREFCADPANHRIPPDALPSFDPQPETPPDSDSS